MDLSCDEDYERGVQEDSEPIDVDATIEYLAILVQKEATYPRPSNYITTVQTQGMDATWRRRICDWMIYTGKTFEISVDAIACAVHLMDQYLCVLSVDKIVLQLLSMVCLHMSSKVHEHRPITLEEMELLSHGIYPQQEMIKMETRVLDIISWKMYPPLAIAFARDLIAFETSAETKSILQAGVTELLDECLSEYSFMEFLESVKAIAAIEVVFVTHFHHPCPLVKFAIDELHFPVNHFQECVELMLVVMPKKFVPPPIDTSHGNKSNTNCLKRSATPTGVEASPRYLSDVHIDRYHKKARKAATASST
ncbi:unnamed protein product [Aphanomyces euteiches]